jgi:hypothetical protein
MSADNKHVLRGAKVGTYLEMRVCKRERDPVSREVSEDALVHGAGTGHDFDMLELHGTR